MKIALHIYVGLLALTVLLWPLLVITSTMNFDAPGSQDNILVHLLLYWALGYPLPILVGAVGQWRNRARVAWLRTAFYAGVASLSLVIPVVLVTLLEVFCDGQFACSG